MSEYFSINFFNLSKSFPSLTKDKAIQSTSKEIANFTSFLSFEVNEEVVIFVFGRLTPFLDLRHAGLKARIITLLFLSVLTTSKLNFPSSIKIEFPALVSFAKLM